MLIIVWVNLVDLVCVALLFYSSYFIFLLHKVALSSTQSLAKFFFFVALWLCKLERGWNGFAMAQRWCSRIFLFHEVSQSWTQICAKFFLFASSWLCEKSNNLLICGGIGTRMKRMLLMFADFFVSQSCTKDDTELYKLILPLRHQGANVFLFVALRLRGFVALQLCKLERGWNGFFCFTKLH